MGFPAPGWIAGHTG
ncbi:hypothetical protein A2U01_0075860, partial [Trifolium medium]|nr:hypothetical protein [Trifolium medium]